MRRNRPAALILAFGALWGCAATQFTGATVVEVDSPRSSAKMAASAAPTASETVVVASLPSAPPPVVASVSASATAIAPGPPRVVVLADRLLINERIQFASGSAEILAASQMLLFDIATTLNDHLDIRKVRVEGHASAEGDEAANVKLSGERAKAIVTTLVQLGVAQERLTARGFGASEPIASNDTEEGREKNRRVAFVILQRASVGKGVGR